MGEDPELGLELNEIYRRLDALEAFNFNNVMTLNHFHILRDKLKKQKQDAEITKQNQSNLTKKLNELISLYEIEHMIETGLTILTKHPPQCNCGDCIMVTHLDELQWIRLYMEECGLIEEDMDTPMLEMLKRLYNAARGEKL